MVIPLQSDVLRKAMDKFLALGTHCLNGEHLLPLSFPDKDRAITKASMLVVVVSISTSEQQVPGEVIRTMGKEGASEEFLTHAPIEYRINLAVVPAACSYADALESTGAFLRIIHDHSQLPLPERFMSDANSCTMVLCPVDLAFRAEVHSLYPSTWSGLTLHVQLEIAIESALLRGFSRVKERKLSAERMPAASNNSKSGEK